MSRLEHLCVQYLEACIGHRNVLAALQNAARLKLDYIKVCVHTLTWHDTEKIDQKKLSAHPSPLLFHGSAIERIIAKPSIIPWNSRKNIRCNKYIRFRELNQTHRRWPVCLQEYCLKYIVKETNWNQIVMSKDFESLDQPLMVQIIRRKELPPVKYFLEPHCENINSKFTAGSFSRLKAIRSTHWVTWFLQLPHWNWRYTNCSLLYHYLLYFSKLAGEGHGSVLEGDWPRVLWHHSDARWNAYSCAQGNCSGWTILNLSFLSWSASHLLTCIFMYYRLCWRRDAVTSRRCSDRSCRRTASST